MRSSAKEASAGSPGSTGYGVASGERRGGCGVFGGREESMASANMPLSSSSAFNSGKTIEETYQRKTQLEHVLLRPDTYVGSIEKHAANLWCWEGGAMVQRLVTYVPGLYKIFDEILVNAADNKQRDPSMDLVKVTIDSETNTIKVRTVLTAEIPVRVSVSAMVSSKAYIGLPY